MADVSYLSQGLLPADAGAGAAFVCFELSGAPYLSQGLPPELAGAADAPAAGVGVAAGAWAWEGYGMVPNRAIMEAVTMALGVR